jgi:dihydrofolate reductase
MNNTPKVVFSRTLKKAEWGAYNNVTLIRERAAEEIVRLKAQPGKNMVIYGSANLVQGLTELSLIDEYQLLVHPVLLGQGKTLFSGQAASLKLIKTEAFTNGVVVLYYRPK